MTSHTCPDWPALMEISPELQFFHRPLGEVQLPAEAFVKIDGVAFDEVCICCDADAHVYNPEHTSAAVVAALLGTHWIDVRELARPALNV